MNGVKYFKCQKKRGLFVRQNQVFGIQERNSVATPVFSSINTYGNKKFTFSDTMTHNNLEQSITSHQKSPTPIDLDKILNNKKKN